MGLDTVLKLSDGHVSNTHGPTCNHGFTRICWSCWEAASQESVALEKFSSVGSLAHFAVHEVASKYLATTSIKIACRFSRVGGDSVPSISSRKAISLP